MCQKRGWHGDSTEVALVELLTKTGINRTRKFPRIAEFPFDSSRKCNNNTSNRKGILVITKGAVEVLLDKIDEHQNLF
jgi:Ca2+-transporting ATPase